MSSRRTVDVDVAIVGAGPAGIAAACVAAECGLRALIIDENPNAGGQIWRHLRGTDPGGMASKWLARLTGSGASRWQGASVIDVTAQAGGVGFELIVESSSPATCITARAIVLATGARERFLPFPGWTLPGVIGVGGAQALVKSGASFATARVVIAGSGPLLLPVASTLTRGGANVLLVAEQATRKAVLEFGAGLWSTPATLVQAVRYRAAFMRSAYKTGWWVTEARGVGRVEEVELTNGEKRRIIACDTLCAAFGLVPNTEVARLAGCELSDELPSRVVVDDDQRTSVPAIYCAGESTGIGGVELAVAEGEIAGYCAVGRPKSAASARRRRQRGLKLAGRMDVAFALRDELRHLARPDTIVCRCEDVPQSAVDPSWGMRRAKLYARAGMGPCQGRICGVAFEFTHGWSGDRVRLPSETALVSTLLACAPTRATTHDKGDE